MTTAKKRLHDSRDALRRRLVSREEAVERVHRSDCPWGEIIDETIHSAEVNKAIIIRFGRAFRSGDVETLRELTTPDYCHWPTPARICGRWVLFNTANYNKLKDWDRNPLAYDRITEGDRVATWPVDLPKHICLVYQLREGLVSESHNASFPFQNEKGSR